MRCMTILHHLGNKRTQEPRIRRRRRSPLDMGYDYKKHLEEYEKEKAKVEKKEMREFTWQEDSGKVVC